MFLKKGKEKNAAANDDRIRVDTSTITTMIGADTVVKGLVETKASIRINGVIEGDVRADGIVILTKSGHIIGTIEAESIIVAGRIDGNMSIRDKVNVEPTGQIYGEIITKKFVIDEESVFEGNVVMNRDGKIVPVTPYKSEAKIEEEKQREKLINEKAEELAKKLADEIIKEKEKSEKESKNKDKKNKDSKDESEDKKDKDEKDDKSDPEDKEDKSEESKDEDKPADKDDDKSGKKDETAKDSENKDSEIIIADINEIKDGEDIPVTDAAGKGFLKKSKSLSVEVQDE